LKTAACPVCWVLRVLTLPGASRAGGSFVGVAAGPPHRGGAKSISARRVPSVPQPSRPCIILRFRRRIRYLQGQHGSVGAQQLSSTPLAHRRISRLWRAIW
jgi:hypothetical protein